MKRYISVEDVTCDVDVDMAEIIEALSDDDIKTIARQKDVNLNDDNFININAYYSAPILRRKICDLVGVGYTSTNEEIVASLLTKI